MKRWVKRAKRWRPVFPGTGRRGSIFFYSGSTSRPTAAFFHHHHGDHRPHLHLVEFPNRHHLRLQNGHDGNDRETERCRPHQHHRGVVHRERPDHPGHWHFAFADVATTQIPHLLQILALDWIIINFVTDDCANDLRLTIDRWARPPP
jgi:hypothetical protein